MWNGVPTFIGKGNTGIALFPANQEPKTSTHREIRMLHLAFRADRENFVAAQRELRKHGIKFEFEDHMNDLLERKIIEMKSLKEIGMNITSLAELEPLLEHQINKK